MTLTGAQTLEGRKIAGDVCIVVVGAVVLT